VRDHPRGATLPRRGAAALLAAFKHLTVSALLVAGLITAAPRRFSRSHFRVPRVACRRVHARPRWRARGRFATSPFFVKDPERLVVELEGMDLNEELKSLASKVRDDDPYIKPPRIAVNRPGVVAGRLRPQDRGESPTCFPWRPWASTSIAS